MQQTASNIAFLKERVARGFTPDSLSSANQKAFAMLSELTDEFSDTDLIYEDESFEKSLDLLVAAIKEKLGPVPEPKKKQLTERQKRSASQVKKRARGKKAVAKSAKKDGADFAARMRAARAAKSKGNSVPAAVDTPAVKTKGAKKAKVAKQNSEKVKSETAPKVEKVAQPSKQDQAYLNAKHVKVSSVELKHIKRFVSLTKDSSKDKVISALETLQKDIKKGILTKRSPWADEIEEMQDTYLAILNRGQSPYKVYLSEERLAHYVALAGGEKVYKSVELLLKYIGWTEEIKTEEQIHKLLAEIRNAVKKGKIQNSDPYSDEVRSLERMLASAGSGKKFNGQRVQLDGIRGLAGLGCACQQALSGLGSLAPMASGGVLNASQLMNHDYPKYEFTGSWGSLLGQPAKNAKLMIWGEPGQGKSTMGYQLARYLASSFGKVLYISTEEISSNGQASMTVQTKLKAVGGAVDNWQFAGDLSKINGSHQFVFIDSVNDSGLTEEQFDKLVAKYPNTFFILIFQATKTGQFKGEKNWEHLVDMVANVHEGQVKTTKNRYAALSTIKIF